MLPNRNDNSQTIQETLQVGEPEPTESTTKPVDTTQKENDEEKNVGMNGDVLVVGEDAFDDVEVEGEQQGDSADIGVTAVGNLQQSGDNSLNGSREQLIQATKDDTSLDSIKQLAETEANGYKWEDQLLFKYQLDQFGNPTKRLCVPSPFRDKCMVTAHDKFGHRGKNKVARDLAQLFYWPSLWRDVALHCRACKKCQEFSKAKPRHSPMVEWEVITVPSERVAIDLVGPLPKARGGMRVYPHMHGCCYEVARGGCPE